MRKPNGCHAPLVCEIMCFYRLFNIRNHAITKHYIARSSIISTWRRHFLCMTGKGKNRSIHQPDIIQPNTAVMLIKVWSRHAIDSCLVHKSCIQLPKIPPHYLSSLNDWFKNPTPSRHRLPSEIQRRFHHRLVHLVLTPHTSWLHKPQAHS